MLLRFTVENVLCFNAEASLSMVATSDDRHPDHVTNPPGTSRPAILRAAALYGANGHGKSNFVNAVIALKQLVMNKRWSTERFKLDPSSNQRPSRLVAEFRHNSFDYEYGVVLNGDIVSEEWLFRTPKRGAEVKLFERTTVFSGKKFITKVTVGPKIARLTSPADGVDMATYINVFSSGMKETRTFIYEAHERGIGEIDAAYEWFDDILTPVSATASYSPLFERVGAEEEFRVFLEGFLRQCDVGISNITTSTVKIDQQLSSKLPKEVAREIDKLESDGILHIGGPDGHSMVVDHDEDGNVVIHEIASHRYDTSGNKVKFTFDEESSGTRRLLDLAPMLADPDDRRAYVVDELDRKLHPMLAYQFIEAFLATTKRQIIFTTHNTFLMSLDLLRRDEVWFIQKRDDGSSSMYSLSELKIRPDLNVRKGYLSGRFGAVPFLGNTTDLGWSNCVVQEHAAN